MNAKFLIPLCLLGALSACSKNDSSANTTHADYAETEQKLIQYREQDSREGDSVNASTAMPPQETPSENGH